MPKKSNGEGSITRRKDGLWQASLQVNGTRRTVYAKTEREVRAKLRDLQQKADSPVGLPASGRRTVNDLLTAWLENAPGLKPSTVSKNKWFLDSCARPSIGNLKLDKVTPDRLQVLYANLTPAVAEKVHRLLHRAFSVAILWRWMTANPCDHVLRPAYKVKAKTLWTRAELDLFLAGTTDHWLNPLWVVLIATGCRLGEALALQWAHVDLEHAVVSISQTLHRIDGEWILDSAKTDSSVRTLVLPTIAVEALRKQMDKQAAQREAAGSAWEEWGLVFTGETGLPLFASTAQHGLKRECARLSLPVITPHGLRHLHASLLLDEGVPVTAVSARLGHANPQITMKIYAHAMPGQDQRAADAIGGVLRRAADKAPETPPAE